MSESFPQTPEENEKEPGLERIFSREEILAELGKRLVYQRKGSFEGRGRKIESAATTIRVEDADDGYARTTAEYDPISGTWKSQ